MRRWPAGAAGLLIALAAVFGAGPAAAQGQQRLHAMALVDAARYPADFKHFSWVNPDAPKGGRVRLYDPGSFDTLNVFPAQGEAATGLTLLYDRLFVGSPDEASAEYGLIAEWASYPADISSVTFGLRPQAQIGRAHV